MRTFVMLLAFACAVTNTLLLADWILRGEWFFAGAAGCMGALAGAVLCLAHRCRF